MTLLIASIFAESVEEAATRSAAAWEKGADAVEVRIDCFRDAPADLAAFLGKHRQRTWIVTCRGAAEGGTCVDDATTRAARVAEAVRGTGAFVDFELADWRDWKQARDILLAALGNGSTSARLILSVHDFTGVPPDVGALVDEALRAGTSVVAKAAYSGAHICDSFAALDVMHDHGRKAIAICMGEEGSWTRVLAKKLGAFASYAAPSPQKSTAPGQWTIDDLRGLFRWREIDADTKVYGVLGDPVAHSMSPALFNRWFAECGLNAVYLPLRVRPEDGGLTRLLDGCARRPWFDIGGFSVTIPHKASALSWAGETADPMSRGIGAANTLCFGPGGAAAYNTDCYAAISSLTEALGCARADLAGLSVDVLGAGGAASAILFGLCEFGCRATVYGRAPDACKRLTERFGCAARPWEDRVRRTGEVVINCTPAGMWPEVNATPLPADALQGCRLVFDLVYRPLQTKLLADAAAAGCQTLSGLDMFVRQAVTQFELWTGRSPDGAGALEFLKRRISTKEPLSLAGGGRCIALIGFRGSGKTTVGRELAALLGGKCIDTDDLVVDEAGRNIAEIFADEGETGFRRREAEAIRRIVASPPAVLSVGGGAVLDERNVAALRSVATIVWLAAPATVLGQRIAADPGTAASRPSLTGLCPGGEVERLLEDREPYYRHAAELIVDTTDATPVQVAREIVSRLGLNLQCDGAVTIRRVTP